MNTKKRLANFIRGWLPEEPDFNSIKRTMSGRYSMNKPFVGAFLISLGITALLFSILIATRTDTVIDTSFVLKPKETFGSTRTEPTIMLMPLANRL